MKLKERVQTDAVVLYYELTDKTVSEILISYKKEGLFYPPWHFYITEDGQIKQGRPVDVVAGSNYPNNEETIVILINSPDDININHDQAESIDQLLTKIFKEYTGIERMDIRI